VLVASPSYLQRRGAPTKIGELERHDCVVFGRTLSGVVWRLEGADGTNEILVRGRLAVDSAEAALRATTAGLGIALLPNSMVAEQVERGRLQRVLADYHIAGGLYAVYPSNRHPPAALSALLNFTARMAATLRE
jgi:DNA-binding transcriptional LysR family regulator